ncbi:MAG: YARHG domain-containing protein [Firmicutes bacterium]|nr:YARHG domain-containing protein [Bacillota bacterium]
MSENILWGKYGKKHGFKFYMGFLILILLVVLGVAIYDSNQNSNPSASSTAGSTNQSSTKSGVNYSGPSQNSLNTNASPQPTYIANGRWPWTSTRPVTYGDLTGLSQWELDLMRNEIYARHGWSFSDPGFKSYFESQPWYRIKSPGLDRDSNNRLVEAEMTELEKNNAAAILNYSK